jgi:methylamine---glutamate N-methyltransferase subunit B
VAAVSPATAEPVVLDCDALSLREVNAALAELPEGAHARVVNPGGRHNLAVGLTRRIRVEVAGNAGYYLAGLCDGPDVSCDGFVGTGLAENLMSGTVRVAGDASASAAATARGGTVVVAGDASARAGISLKGGTLLVGGSCGHMCGFMAQAGVILIGGDAGDALGDSLYEAVIYVAGSIRSLGADARIEELTAADVQRVAGLCAHAGFDHVDPEEVTKVTSARQLYHFDTFRDHRKY